MKKNTLVHLVGALVALWCSGCASTTSPQPGPIALVDAESDVLVSDVGVLDGASVVEDQGASADTGQNDVGELVITWQGEARESGSSLDLGQSEHHGDADIVLLTVLNNGPESVSLSVAERPDGVLVSGLEPGGLLAATEMIEVRLELDTSSARSLMDQTLSIQAGSGEDDPFEIRLTGRVRSYVRDVAEPNPSFRDALERIRQSAQLAGLAAAVVQGRDILAVEGVGDADREAGVPIDPRRTLFRWASVSKSLAGVVALRSRESIDLDASITEYMPEYQVPARYLEGRCQQLDCASNLAPDQRRISLRQLLTHRAGIQHYRNGVFDPTPPAEEVNDPMINTGIEWAIDYFVDNPLVSVPGTRTEYSSFGYNLAGVVLERALGLDYESLVLTNVAHRLGMNTMVADRSWVELPDRAAGYALSQNQLVRDSDDDVSWKLPGGGFTSTVVDLARYCGGLMDDVLLPQAVRDDPLWAPSAPNENYGLGFVLGQQRGQRFIHHTGLQRKAATNLRLYPDEGLCVVMMTNTLHGDPGEIGRRVESAWRNPGGCNALPPISLGGREVRVGLSARQVAEAYDDLTAADYRITDIDAYSSVDGVRFNLVAEESLPGRHIILAGLTGEEFMTTHAQHQERGLRLSKLESFQSMGRALYIGIWRDGPTGQTVHLDLDAPQLEQLRSRGEINLRSLSAINVDGGVRYSAIDDPTAAVTTLHIAEPRARYLEIVGGARRQGLVVRRIEWLKSNTADDLFIAELDALERSGGLLGPMACDALVAAAMDASAEGRSLTRLAAFEVDGDPQYSLVWETP